MEIELLEDVSLQEATCLRECSTLDEALQKDVGGGTLSSGLGFSLAEIGVLLCTDS